MMTIFEWILVAVAVIILYFVLKNKVEKDFHTKECLEDRHEVINYTSKWMAKPWKANELLGEKIDPWSYRYTGYKLKKIERACKHCGKTFSTFWTKIGEYTEISSDSDTMDKFHENGIVEWD
ncbi:MAG TPA: hypothetical protein DC057_04460 [Spirochaetia bacterium]|nr:hypothetical protein [Spirochaetia bacterium]